MPFYGDPQLMRQAVLSVLAQTTPFFRLVVVDDCYPDESVPKWFESLNDARVAYHRNHRTLGVNGNFSRLLDLADAEYVAFLGCDDLLHPGFAECVMTAIADYGGAEIIAPRARVIDRAGAVVEPLGDRVKARLAPSSEVPVRIDGEDALVSLLRGNWLYFPGLCWRRSVINDIGFRPEYGVVLDLALIVDVLLDGGEILVLPETLFDYRRHAASESSVTASTGARFEEERSFFRATEQRLLEARMPRAARAARHHITSRLHAATLVPAAVRTRQWTSARSLAAHACR